MVDLTRALPGTSQIVPGVFAKGSVEDGNPDAVKHLLRELIDRVEITPERHAYPYFWVPAGCDNTGTSAGKPGPEAPPVSAHSGDTGWLFVTSSGGGASKSQPRWTVAGRPIYLGERKLALPTCRDEVAEAVEALAAGGGERVLTVGKVYAAMAACGSLWSRATDAKTMLRMTRPARRPPYLRLDRIGPDQCRLGGFAPRVAYPAS